MTASATAERAGAAGRTATAERTPAATARSPADARGPLPSERRPVPARVPEPVGVDPVVPLTGLVAGGLDAIQAEWGAAGGRVLLTGRRPFLDVTARAGFGPDGSFDGSVDVVADVVVLGLPLGAVRWSVTGWEPGRPIATPSVRLRGPTLHLDLDGLPAEAGVTTAAGTAARRDGPVAELALPGDAVPPGQPLEPRYAELFRGLLGPEVADAVVHPDAPVGEAPAFVTDSELFFAPGIYGSDAPEALRLLDAALRSALAGLVGPVGDAPPPPPTPPVPDASAGAAAPAGAAPSGTAPSGTVPSGAASSTPSSGPAAAAAEGGTGSAAESGETGPAAAPEGGVGTPGGAPAEAGVAGAAAAEGEAQAAAGGEPAGEAGAEGEAAPVVELVMPEAPTELTEPARQRGAAVAGGGGRAARAARNLPSAEENVSGARGEVTEPAAETLARAQAALVAELGAPPAPSPEIVALAERIVTAIEENRPEDEDELLETDPTEEARQAGATVTGTVEGQVEEVGGTYDQLAEPPAGTPALTPSPVETPERSSRGMGVDAAQAAPDPIPPENRSLDADVENTDQRIAESGIDTRVTREIPDGPFEQTRTARGGLGELAERTPAEIDAAQTAAIERSQVGMAELQLQAVATMRAARGRTVGGVDNAQGGMVASEENTRESVSNHAKAVYELAAADVDDMVADLSATAMTQWDAGLEQLSEQFYAALDRVKRWIEDRHSGALGTLVAIGDYVTGLPGWVTDEYIRAERAFGRGVADLLIKISTDVNGVLGLARARIQAAEREIDEAYAAMEGEFPEWAAQERARFGGMLAGLSRRVDDAETGFVREVSQKATTAVNEAHAAAEVLREEARGLIGKVVGAIAEFIDDPVRAIINGLLRLVGIPPSAFWGLIARIEQVISDIADDPETFVNNLVAGVGQGFQQFFDNIGMHLIRGFWTWLFSGLQSPVPFPTDFSVRGLMTFALQIMGITWPRVREVLVRHLGPEAVELMEATWQLVTTLIERGPEGILELIKEQLTPENLIGMVLDAAIDYIVETLIEQVIIRVIGLFNPVGAIAQAIELIYKVCAWIFQNAAQLFRFVEAVVNGMADVLAGNIGGLANKVEQALAMLIPPVIDFLAGLLSLGDLPEKVAEIIVGLQERVMAALERIIVWLVERGKALLRRMGVMDEEGAEPEADDAGGGDDELGRTVRFSGGGESHRTWVRLAGSAATLMVASTPMAITDKIAQWRAQVAAGEPADDAARAEASASLGNLETMVSGADEQADRLAQLFLEAERSEDPEAAAPSDNALENRQRAIAGLLSRLFELFEGGKQTAEWLNDMEAYLPGEGQKAMDAPYRDWALRMPEFTIGNEPNDPRIWPVGTLDGTRTTAAEYIAAEPTHRLLLPYFQAAPGEREVETAAFSNHVFTQDSGDPVRRTFREHYGGKALTELQSTAVTTVGAYGGVDETYKGKLLDRVEKMDFFWDSPGGGRITFPTERPPDHTRYRPSSVVETEVGGVRTVRYHTATGQEFSSTTDSTNGLSISVTGRNLRFMAGRGVTEGSPAFTSGNGFDRSHIIANELGGSGFAVGRNLVTASATYNQQVMRGAERRIGDAVAAYAAAHSLPLEHVSFTMDVRVSFGALLDPVALAQVKAVLPDRVGTDLDAEIRQKINAGQVHPDLMRITGVTYTWTFTDPAGEGSTEQIGPDLWLLMNG